MVLRLLIISTRTIHVLNTVCLRKHNVSRTYAVLSSTPLSTRTNHFTDKVPQRFKLI